jgi:hypothetical protein
MSRLMLLAALFAFASMAVAAEDPAEPTKKHKLSVAFKVPSSSEKAAITEVRQVGKELWVRVDVTGGGGVGLAVISTAKAEAEVEAPALPVKYIVFGKKWGWKNEEKGIMFIKDLESKAAKMLEKHYEGGKVVYKAKKKEK